MYKLLSLLSVSLTSTMATASPDVQVELRSYSSTHCQYYSSTVGDFNVTLTDANVPSNAKVTLVVGFLEDRGYERSDWALQREIVMQASPQRPSSWSTLFSEAIASRSGPHASALQFVFKIENESVVRFEKGNDSVMGYYQAALSNHIACDSTGPFFQLPIVSVEKN